MQRADFKKKRIQRLKGTLGLDERIEVNPRIVLGKPVIRGTRITVDFILKLLGQGMAEEEVLSEFPQLEREDIVAVLRYAYGVLQEERVYPLTRTPVAA